MWTRQGRWRYVRAMKQINLERDKRLAEALRANLRKRKASHRSDGCAVEPPVMPVIPAGGGVED